MSIRRLSQIICLSCGKEFRPKLSKRKFCSNKCYHQLRIKNRFNETKTCPKCNVEKSRDGFFIVKKNPGQLSSWCRECLRTRYRPVYNFECVDCGRPMQRPKRYTDEKEANQTNRCIKCAKNKIIRENGGVPVNYNGTNNFAGRTFSTWMASAKRRGIEWSITKQQVEEKFQKQNGLCALSGIKMEPKKNTPYRPSIDRIDSTKGYFEDNIQFICSRVNVMKNKFNQDEFVRLCGTIHEYNKEK